MFFGTRQAQLYPGHLQAKQPESGVIEAGGEGIAGTVRARFTRKNANRVRTPRCLRRAEERPFVP